MNINDKVKDKEEKTADLGNDFTEK
jgi:hypothetical protein